MSAFAPKKGGAGLSLPSSSSADAQRAVNKAIEDLAEKYGVDLPAGDAGAGAGAGPGVEERYDAAAEAFFAAENDAAVANKKRIVSQAAFDEVVNENIEDFEMEPEEALADAIEQFEKQGVDLSAVVRKVGGASSAPVASSLEKLKGDMPQDELLSLLAEISTHLSQDVENRIAFYASSGEIYLLNAIGKIKDEASDELHAAVLEVYSKSFWRGRPLSDRPYFDSGVYLSRMVASESAVVRLQALRASRAYMVRNEEGKKFAMKDLGLDTHVISSLKMAVENGDRKLLREVCKVIRVLCVNDDKREGVTPEIFPRARRFGECGRSGEEGLLPYLTPAVEDIVSRKVEDEESISDILYAVHSITVNDSICKDMTERGNTARMIELLDRFAADSPKLALLACRCVTALANNDGNKQVVCRSGGVDGILKMLSCNEANPKIQSQGISCLGSLALRQTDHCKLIIEKHGVSIVLTAMRNHPAELWVQRSSCILLRNVVARAKEHVQAMKDAGAVELITAARQNHPYCNDVAFAALRDLGTGAKYKE